MRFQDLLAYKKSSSLAMKIFEVTKSFPKEEMYSLTDQIRRSSRSVPVTMAEGYRKRIYPKHFYSKLTDCDGENSETQVWLEFALACNYISESVFNEFVSESLEIGKLINYMLLNPEKFGVKKD
ncbi:four helix bundle protein [Flavobacterium muglaense]|uniref:Four helix bundle protein n=1 Tax=Flavobacterium muglaense TaxID=2764716 RepID=A0A923MYN8_9FLAO|nr:four helix bundle protein [Flavobacterium muglaense]MBC5836955.1 four helix bundle protein [Flavobacterium muglaense]MBC5843484.1 four helix bundle protein [Flavobacterium muglaense]